MFRTPNPDPAAYRLFSPRSIFDERNSGISPELYDEYILVSPDENLPAAVVRRRRWRVTRFRQGYKRQVKGVRDMTNIAKLQSVDHYCFFSTGCNSSRGGGWKAKICVFSPAKYQRMPICRASSYAFFASQCWTAIR